MNVFILNNWQIKVSGQSPDQVILQGFQPKMDGYASLNFGYPQSETSNFRHNHTTNPFI